MLEAGQETYDGFMFISISWLCLCIYGGTVKTHGKRQVNFSKYMHCTLPQCTERDFEHFPFYTIKSHCMNVGKKHTTMPFSFSVALILYNLQDKRWMQLLSAPAAAVRVHQKTSSCSLTSRPSATIQIPGAAVSWPLSVMDETTECSLLLRS